MDIYKFTWTVSGLFCLVASGITLDLIYKHLQHYNTPSLQRYIVRILWLIPIYALDAFLSLRFYESSLYFDVWRDCYEAYVLYCFFSLLIAYLNGVDALEEILESKPPIAHPFPLCFLPKFKPGRQFLLWSRRCVLQFVFVKPILACVSLFLDVMGMYDEASINLKSGYLYIAIANNVSITLSLYFLVLFYMSTEENLQPFKPLPQFLCVKAIIFFSFWQGIIIIGLVKFNMIVDVGQFTAGNIALFGQNFLICIEMLVLAIVHRFVFDYQKFVKTSPRDCESFDHRSSPSRPKDSSQSSSRIPKNIAVLKNLQDVADVSDMLDDARSVLSPLPKHSKKY